MPNSFKQPHFSRKHCYTPTTDILYLYRVGTLINPIKAVPKARNPTIKVLPPAGFAEYAVVVSTERACICIVRRYQRVEYLNPKAFIHIFMDFPQTKTLYQQQKQLIIIMVKMWCAKSKQRLYTAPPLFIVVLVPYFL